MMITNPILHIENISKSYGKVSAVRNFSIKVNQETRLTIMGPSGSGKTTLLRLIAGLETPDDGYIYMNGSLVSSNKLVLAPHLRQLGFVFQTPALWPHMTVTENITFGLNNLQRVDQENRAFELLASMKIEHLSARYPEQLSGGEARRVSIARALAPRPKCILMDEPLTNLDQDLKSTLLDIINKVILEHKISLLYVTHDLKEAQEISGDLIYINGGVLNQ